MPAIELDHQPDSPTEGPLIGMGRLDDDGITDAQLAELLGDPDTAEADMDDEFNLENTTLYLSGRSPEEAGEVVDGMPYEAHQEWLASLSPEERDELDEQRAAIAERETLAAKQTERLRETAPELLIGRLPAELEARLANKPYLLGVNQSGGVETTADAAIYVERAGGVDLRQSSIPQRFLLAGPSDPPEIAEMAMGGYYGPESGRFVFVFPFEKELDDSPHAIVGTTYEEEAIAPEDMHITVQHPNQPEITDKSINPKYCAGFIDTTGTFTPNQHFMQSPELELTTAE